MAITARSIDAYLKRHGSPLAGLGSVFMAQGPRVAGLLVAIAGAESSFGKITSGSKNPFGWGPGISFPSWQAAIQTVGRGLQSGYLTQGRTSIPAIGAKWAPSGAANDPTNLNSNWVRNVRKFYRELGGGSAPGASVAPSPALPGGNMGSGNTSSAPGLPDAALSSLSDIGSGRYDPLRSLQALTESVRAGGITPAAPTSPAAPVSTAPSGPGITYSGQKLTHQTDGLAGYPAVDLFAAPGTAFNAPENGKVIRLSGRGGTSGNVFGYSVYFQGDSGKTYFLTHLNANRAPVGSRLRKGQRIGSVSQWRSGSPHAHVGIHG